MQTFLPYSNFSKCAKVLDRQRLCKQRVEVLQILKALNKETKGWQNHPITKMWKGYEECLIKYGLAICKEWINRGYKDTCYNKILKYSNKTRIYIEPNFIGNEDFHNDYKKILLEKKYSHYSQYFNYDVK